MSLSRITCVIALCFSILSAPVQAQQTSAQTQWQAEVSSDGSMATARHEASAVGVGDRLFLMGGRGNRPVEVYDTVTQRWQTLDRAPVDLHHFQPVVIGTDIYALGSLVAGGFPQEASEPGIHVFDTTTFTWSVAGEVPENRRRGSAAAVVRDDIIYLLGGNTLGHNGGAVAWFDSYDPQTGEWTILEDAPHARDHFAAAVVLDKLVAAGGRRSTTGVPGSVFANTVATADIYDFATRTWIEGADIPTMRAGTVVASAGTELLIAGGEVADNELALATVEAYDVVTNQWRQLQEMIDARHSGGAAVVGTTWHIVAGSVRRGGGGDNETSNHETLDLGVALDTDNDGLDDVDELAVHSTDPEDPDTDNDELGDGDEVQIGSDPNNSDTDEDTLTDGAEVNEHASSPLLVDTDDDRLTDDVEVQLGSDPNNTDTDSDSLTDGDEVNEYQTNPVLTDSDEDGLADGAEVVAGTNPLEPDSDADGMLDGVDDNPLVAAIKPKAKRRSGQVALWLLMLLGVYVTLRKQVFKRQ